MKKILKEFKDFISKGNVLDLAVGMIIGSAFTAIVTSLVNDILMPFIGMLLAGINFETLGVTIPWGNQPFIAFGKFLSAIITFLITALCLFLVVKGVNALRNIKKKDEAPAEPTTKICPHCMSEINIKATKCPHCTSDLED